MRLDAARLSSGVLSSFAFAFVLACAEESPTVVRWEGLDQATQGCHPTARSSGDDQNAASARRSPAPSSANTMVQTTNCNATVELYCPFQVSWGSSIGCYIAVEPAMTYYNVISWTATAGGMGVVGTKAGGDSWAGILVTSTTIQVDVDIDGGITTVGAPILVQPRTSLNWPSSMGGGPADSTEIDPCFAYGGSEVLGRTVSVSCPESGANHLLFEPWDHSPADFVNVAKVPYGPNGNLWYVASTSIDMRLKYAVNPRYRSDGAPIAVANSLVAPGCQAFYGNTDPRNHFHVNSVCYFVPPYFSMLSHIGQHEARHVTAATTAARDTPGDLPKRLRSIFGSTADQVKQQARTQYEQAHTYVLGKTVFADSAPKSQNFIIYHRTLAFNWRLDTIRTVY